MTSERPCRGTEGWVFLYFGVVLKGDTTVTKSNLGLGVQGHGDCEGVVL